MNALPELDHPDLPPALRARLLGWMEAARQEARARHEQLQLAQQTAVSLNETLRRTQQTLERRDAELAARELAYQKVVHGLAQLKRLRYGVKSEALSAAMRDLFDETLAADIAACEARLEALAPVESESKPPARKRNGRAPLPAHLERVSMPTKPRYSNSIQARARPNGPICGPTGARL